MPEFARYQTKLPLERKTFHLGNRGLVRDYDINHRLADADQTSVADFRAATKSNVFIMGLGKFCVGVSSNFENVATFAGTGSIPFDDAVSHDGLQFAARKCRKIRQSDGIIRIGVRNKAESDLHPPFIGDRTSQGTQGFWSSINEAFGRNPVDK